MGIIVKEYDDQNKLLSSKNIPYNGKLLYYVALKLASNGTKNIWLAANKSYSKHKGKISTNKNTTRILASIYLLKTYGVDQCYVLKSGKQPFMYCWFNPKSNYKTYIFNV